MTNKVFYLIFLPVVLIIRGRSSLNCKEVYHGVVHEGALLPTLLYSLQRYYPNITIIWDGRICMFAFLLRFTLSLSRMRDWTVAVAQTQYSKFAC
jgi:hypothetical protein